MDLEYFILGNDYLKAFEISLLNNGVCRFTIGSRVFHFDKSINAVQELGMTVANRFEAEVLQNAEINPLLGQSQREDLLRVMQEFSSAFATTDQEFGAVIGHEKVGLNECVEITTPVIISPALWEISKP
ncbi:hypothetical protein PCANC_09204 [Puccinia coronata f. sp. avenae]|uniref:Uncharacterized protein n=1 Tax=Puccinia coronata f. sp. avenae TaxID=200324 RepID=A0A2N5U4M8_9BASI|nr:hypothetical protein PCANC_09204 [Puccinia coronata f. sp. avenae]PLW32638.1 hypothetical protein PCASD_13354 [Puccinia coronata f. sp. avenae]